MRFVVDADGIAHAVPVAPAGDAVRTVRIAPVDDVPRSARAALAVVAVVF